MKPDVSLPPTQKTPPVPIPSQNNPVQVTSFHFLTIHLIIILPSKSGSLKWSLSLTFSLQNPVYASPLIHTCYMPRLSHSRFYRPNSICWAHIKLFFMYLSPPPITLSLIGPNILLNTLLSTTLSLRSSLSVSNHVSHPYKATGNITVLYILILIFLYPKQDVALVIKIQKSDWSIGAAYCSLLHGQSVKLFVDCSAPKMEKPNRYKMLVYIYRVRQRIGRFGNGVLLFLARAGHGNDAARWRGRE